MKKLKLLFALLILSVCAVQCTDEDSVEAAQYEVQYQDGGEEGDQEIDIDRD